MIQDEQSSKGIETMSAKEAVASMAGAGSAKNRDLVSRDRYWDEGLSTEEKIERLHSAVTGLASQLRAVDDILQALLQHRHSPDGQMFQPIVGTPQQKYKPEPILSRYCDHRLTKTPRY